MNPVWNDNVGVVKVSYPGETFQELIVRNSAGDSIRVCLHLLESTDVDKGDPLIYNNPHGKETVLVYYK